MTPERRWRMLRAVLAGAVGLLFAYAAIVKILDPASFARDVRHFRLIPLWGVNFFAVLMPWWELSAAAALFLPGWRRAGAGIALALSCAFGVAVSTVLIRSLEGVSCGCFGNLSGAVGVHTVALDLCLIAACVAVLLPEPRVAVKE
ncbi:MAG: MauE/DoxX family redox-associated membrane protein [Planctomycetota bacterium]|jgi:hypothetical protein